MATLPWYCSREEVKAALDVAETARSDARVDRAIGAASRLLEGPQQLNRRFYPLVATLVFDWPATRHDDGRLRLWFVEHELISVTSLVWGGVTVPADDYGLEPRNDGPPYTRLELDADSTANHAFTQAHRAITLAGVWGYSATTAPAGTLAEVLDASEVAVDVSDSAAVGVGHVIAVESERMIVTGKSMLTTGQTLQTPLAAAVSADLVAVTNGAAYTVGETILLDSERMRIVDIAGNNLVVKRAFDGTTLAAHTGSTVFAPRTLTVERGALGTTAAGHSNGTAISRHLVPDPVRDLAVAESLVQLVAEAGGYARVTGGTDNRQQLDASALAQLRARVMASYGRAAHLRRV